MKPYTDLLRNVLLHGERVENRTGIDTISLPGQSMQFDLREGFPLLTLRKVPFMSVIAELIGFLRGYTSADSFRALGTKIWDANANQNKAWLSNPFRQGADDLGPIYGSQWRQWPVYGYAASDAERQMLTNQGWRHESDDLYYKEVDQLHDCYKLIMSDSSSRRILFHAWNPAELHAMALPPCHLLYQFHCHNYEVSRNNALSLTVYIRSNDLGLGAPFNIASAAALLHLMAAMTCRQVRYLTIQIGDAHVYVNHLDAIGEMLLRDLPGAAVPPLPKLEVHAGECWPAHVDDVIQGLEVGDFELTGYSPLSALKMEMAV
jgi:thymidylate synthase